MENEIKHTENYLDSMLGRESGFSVPDNYFSALEDRFSMVFSKEIAPKENAFKTPENYFNLLGDKILTKVLASEKEVKIITLKQRIRKSIFIAVAASVVLFIGFTYFFNSSENKITFDNLAQNDIENWLLSNAENITPQEMALIITDGQSEELLFNNITKDAIEDYVVSSEEISILNEIN